MITYLNVASSKTTRLQSTLTHIDKGLKRQIYGEILFMTFLLDISS